MKRCSIIIPTYNGSSRISLALDSLIRQTISPAELEIIVVDDASTDTTREIVCAYIEANPEHSIRYIRQELNGGPAKARNVGITHATGVILFFTDDDCEVPAQWIEKHLRVYSDFEEVVGVGGWYTPLIKELGNINSLFVHMFYNFIFPFGILYEYEGYNSELKSHLFPAINTANLSIRKWVVGAVGPFNEHFVAPGSEDLEFSERIREAGFPMYYLPLMVTHYKTMNFWVLLKMAKNRAKGRVVYDQVVSLGKKNDGESLSTYTFWRTFIKYWESVPIEGRKVRLSLRMRGISLIYFFLIYSAISRWYWCKKLRVRAR